MPVTRSGLWYGTYAAAACEPFEPYMQSAVEACNVENLQLNMLLSRMENR